MIIDQCSKLKYPHGASCPVTVTVRSIFLENTMTQKIPFTLTLTCADGNSGFRNGMLDGDKVALGDLQWTSPAGDSQTETASISFLNYTIEMFGKVWRAIEFDGATNDFICLAAMDQDAAIEVVETVQGGDAVYRYTLSANTVASASTFMSYKSHEDACEQAQSRSNFEFDPGNLGEISVSGAPEEISVSEYIGDVLKSVRKDKKAQRDSMDIELLDKLRGIEGVVTVVNDHLTFPDGRSFSLR